MHSIFSKWQHVAGDSTPWGWAMVGLYLTAAVLCLGAADARADPRAALLWRLLAGSQLLLGINKQLDLQLLLLFVGKELARREGWYESRSLVQAAFVVSLVLLSLLCVALFAYAARPVARQFWLPGFGLVMLDLFVLLRAAYFQRFLGRSLGEHGFVLELVGAGLVAVGAQQFRTRRGTRGAE